MEDRLEQVPKSALKALKAAGALVLSLTALALGGYVGKRLMEPGWENVVTYSGFLFFIVLLLANPVLLFFIWIVVAPFFGFAHLHISLGRGIPDLSLSRLILAMLVALVLAQAATGRRRLAPLTRVDFFVLLSLIGIAISITASFNKQASLAWYFESFLMPAVTYWLARNYVTDARRMIHAQRALVAVGLLIALVVLQEQLMGYSWFPTVGSTYYGKHLRRVTGLLGNPAFHAVIVAMTLPFAWRAMLENRRLVQRRLMLLVLGVMYTGLFLTYNRTGWLGGVLGILVFLLFYPRFRRPFLKLSPLLALLMALNWWRIASSYAFTERLVAVNPITYRLQAYTLGWQVFLKHMAIGVGFGNLWQYSGLETPHNSFLWMLVTAGLSGFIPYVGTFLMMGLDSFLLYLKAPRRRGMRRDLLVAFWVALLSYMAQVFAVDMLYGIYPNIVFFFIAGAVLGYHEAIAQEPGSPAYPWTWSEAEGAA